MVQGMTTMTSGGFEPLANGAFMLLRLCVFTPVGQAQTAGQFLGDDLLRVVAQHDVDFVGARVEVVEQPLGVKRAAGSGDGNENFHARIMPQARTANKPPHCVRRAHRIACSTVIESKQLESGFIIRTMAACSNQRSSFVSAAILLAGCASTPTTSSTPAAPEEVISSPPVMTDEMSSLNWADTNRSKPFPAPRSPRPPARPARTNPPYTAPVTTWTSLNRWAAENKIGPPHLVSTTPVATYAIGTANGTMVLDIGSREATWNGVEVHLGFAPQFIDDQIFVHGLDLQKNLEPLLFGPPLTFGNRVIVIDPGHGGVNTGTHSVVDGRFEKEFTLDWALRLAPVAGDERLAGFSDAHQ